MAPLSFNGCPARSKPVAPVYSPSISLRPNRPGSGPAGHRPSVRAVLLAAVLAGAAVLGCGGNVGYGPARSAPPAARASYGGGQGGYGAPPTPAPSPGASYGGDYGRAPRPAAPPSAEGPSPGATRRQAAPTEAPPEERPGLGTEWGERRHSAVRRVNFVRASGQPCAGVGLHYNDGAGLSAMVGYDLERGAGMAPVRVDPRGDISVHLADAGDRPLPAAHVGRRTYVLGQEGHRYGIVLVNHGPRRYEIVASVDGLDVIDGGDASVSKPGYVLDPYARLRIEGFRTSLSEVAAFRFGRVKDSYAARTGTARNVGVIGVALFCERPAPRPQPLLLPPVPVEPEPVAPPEGEVPDEDEIRRRQTANPFPGFAQPPR